MIAARFPRLLFLIALVTLVGVGPAIAHATDASSAEPDPASVEARKSYARGLELYAQREYGRALVEFERAYTLVPSPKLLFALGQTHSGLEQYADAFQVLRAYLDRVGTSVPPERRAQVHRQLEALRARVGELDVTVDVSGATITLDGETAGTSPLSRPMIVDVGRHRVIATLRGHTPGASRVSVVAGQLTQLRFDLEPISRPHRADLATPLWIATGSLAGSSLGSAIIALVHKRSYERALGRAFDGDPAAANRDLQRKRSHVSNWLLVTDILAGATLLGAGASLYFTLEPKTDLEDAKGSRGIITTLGGTF